MPDFQRYQTPDYVHGKLAELIEDPLLLTVIRENPALIMRPFHQGFSCGYNPATAEDTVAVGKDLEAKLTGLAQGMFDLGMEFGTDVREGLTNGDLAAHDYFPLFEAMVGYIIEYFAPHEGTAELRKDLRRSDLAHLLPPEGNVN